MSPGRIALLQAMPIFGALRDDALECLLEGAPWVQRAPGEYYCREGDAAQCMYVIEQGTVEVRKRWDDRDWPLHRLHAGDCFGEMALMDYFPRSASVRAVEPCRAIEIATAALHRLAERDMEQFALIQMNIGREVCRRLRATDELLFRLRHGEALQGEAGVTLI
jgi:CRP/FNR family transcriptional regulator, cyclic AMP receptor protein